MTRTPIATRRTCRMVRLTGQLPSKAVTVAEAVLRVWVPGGVVQPAIVIDEITQAATENDIFMLFIPKGS